jgi:hypothetical protein
MLNILGARGGRMLTYVESARYDFEKVDTYSHLIEFPHADIHRCDTQCLQNYCGSHRSQCFAYKMDLCQMRSV